MNSWNSLKVNRLRKFDFCQFWLNYLLFVSNGDRMSLIIIFKASTSTQYSLSSRWLNFNTFVYLSSWFACLTLLTFTHQRHVNHKLVYKQYTYKNSQYVKCAIIFLHNLKSKLMEICCLIKSPLLYPVYTWVIDLSHY